LEFYEKHEQLHIFVCRYDRVYVLVQLYAATVENLAEVFSL